MRKRLNVEENFSSFAQLEGNLFKCWVTDPRLAKNMRQHCQSSATPEDAKNFWALYWHKQWQIQGHRMADLHLTAHLQEPCYWAAEKIASRFKEKLQYQLDDCFQIALADVPAVLRNFNTNRGASLETFAFLGFRSAIVSELRRAKEIDLCSEWLFLRKLSRKKLQETLEQSGLSAQEKEAYRLAWMCFKQVYAEHKEMGVKQLARPNEESWKAIAKLYNAERLTQLTVVSPACDEEMLERWLTRCIEWGREYLYPSVRSLNTPKPGYSSGELQDDLVSETDPSLMDTLLAEETAAGHSHKGKAINAVLSQAIRRLKAPSPELMRLYYKEHLIQQEIAERLEMKQYTISRRLTRGRELLLKALITWSQEQLGNEMNAEAIAGMGDLLEEWLQHADWATDA